VLAVLVVPVVLKVLVRKVPQVLVPKVLARRLHGCWCRKYDG